MTISELIIYLWLVPLVLQIAVPLTLFSIWVLFSAVKRMGRIFTGEETLNTQLSKA